jgi:hypothetical protein
MLWTGTLPQPALSAKTTTYAEVLPGIAQPGRWNTLGEQPSSLTPSSDHYLLRAWRTISKRIRNIDQPKQFVTTLSNVG